MGDVVVGDSQEGLFLCRSDRPVEAAPAAVVAIETLLMSVLLFELVDSDIASVILAKLVVLEGRFLTGFELV